MATSEANPPPIAGSIGLLFGGLWAYLAAMGLPQRFQLAVEGVAAVITVGLIIVLWTRGDPTGSRVGLFRRRGYIIAVVLEVAAIYVASVLFARFGLQSYLAQAVGVIVGLHFIGLWQATRLPTFLWISGGMCCVSALSAFLPDALNGLHLRNVACGLGNAVVLWIGASQGRGPTDRRPAVTP